MNKIFSTSVFGTGRQYAVGARRQRELARVFYPQWEFRLYTDNARQFADLDANVIEVSDAGDGSFWRFLPLFESDQHIVIVRDADSRVTEREAKAVHEWLGAPHRFHVMRDHENHFADGNAIIASMFGVKGRLPQGIANEMAAYMKQPFVYGRDEEFLDRWVYPLIKDDCLFHCQGEGWFGESRLHLKNPYEFVGNGWDEEDLPLYPPDNGDRRDSRRERVKHRFSGYPDTRA